jgi:hypothetical protein
VCSRADGAPLCVRACVRACVCLFFFSRARVRARARACLLASLPLLLLLLLALTHSLTHYYYYLLCGFCSASRCSIGRPVGSSAHPDEARAAAVVHCFVHDALNASLVWVCESAS